MAGQDDQFTAQLAGHIVGVATALWGKPHGKPTTTEVRFGEGRTVNPQKGTCFYHGEEAGGGVLYLIEREKGLKGGAALDWMRTHGFHFDDTRNSAGSPRAAAQSGPAPRAPIDDKPAPKKVDPDPPKPEGEPKRTIEKVWQYTDEAGAVVLETVRFKLEYEDGSVGKTYGQRRPAMPDDDPKKVRDGKVWTSSNAKIVPYRLGELHEAIANGSTVFFVEGEKTADRLCDLGVPATCNPMGAGKWWDELTEHFRGADVVILPDNDPQSKKPDGTLIYHEDGRPKHVGADHADLVASKLIGVAERVRVLDLPGLKPSKEDAWDWVERGGTVEVLYDLVHGRARDWAPPQAPEKSEAEYRSPFQALLLRDIDAPGPEYEHLIKGIVTRGEVALMVGPSGSGKSFLATHMSLCISRGVDFIPVTVAGRKVRPKVRRGGVLYIASEGARGLKKRLRAYLKHYDVDPATVPFVLLQLPVDLHGSDDHTNLLIAEAKHYGRRFMAQFNVEIELIVIDTLSASSPGANENASDDMSRILSRCKRIQNEVDCAVLIVHHMNATGERERGHTSLRANVDSMLVVKKTESSDNSDRTIRVAEIAKQKDGEDGLKTRFVLPSVKIGTDGDGDPITSCVVDVPDDGNTVDTEDKTGLFEMKTDNARMAFKCLTEALKEHGFPAEAGIDRCKRGTMVVRRTEWSAVIRRRVGLEEPDMKRRAGRQKAILKRALDSFQQWNLIDVDETLVWLTGRPVRGFNVERFTSPKPMAEQDDARPVQDEEEIDIPL